MLTVAQKIKITVIIDNYYDSLLLPGENFYRHRFLKPSGGGIARLAPHISAEHGFSSYIEVAAGGQKSALLMDFGVSENGAANNIKALGLDLSVVGAAVLSHGHYDHFGGLENVMQLAGKKLPLYVGREVFSRRCLNLPGMRVDLGRLDPQRVEAAGCEIREINQPVEILPGVLSVGPIPRVTDFEQGSPILAVERDGGIVSDDFPGEISLVFKTVKGLVILTACAHNGIVNIARRAVELTGVDKIHAVLGGFHLSGAPAEKIEKSVDALSGMGIDQIVPMHCTGFEALKLFSERMPGQFVLYSAGTRYVYS